MISTSGSFPSRPTNSSDHETTSLPPMALPHRDLYTRTNSDPNFLFIDVEMDNAQNPTVLKQKLAFAAKKYHQRKKQASIDRLKPWKSFPRAHLFTQSRTTSHKSGTHQLDSGPVGSQNSQQLKLPHSSQPSAAKISPWNSGAQSPSVFLKTLGSTRAPKLATVDSNQLYTGWPLISPKMSKLYPIPFRWYMPRFIRYFCESFGMSGIQANNQSIAHGLQTIWMQNALSDPCLFHTTLFVGSSNYDLLQGQKQSSVTVYHLCKVISMVNQRFSSSTLALDERTIASVTSLASWAAFNRDRVATDAHINGVQKMIELRAGTNGSDLKGIVDAIVYMNKIVYGIAFGSTPNSPPQYPDALPFGLERRILEAVSEASAFHLLSLFKELTLDIYNLKHQLGCHGLGIVAPGSHHNLNNPPDARSACLLRPPASEDPLYRCCYLACVIFVRIIQARAGTPILWSEIDGLIRNLKALLALTNDKIWLRYFPEVLSWVCIIGAAAANNSDLRMWFYLKQANVVVYITKAHDLSFMDDIWAHFSWLVGQKI